MNSPSTTSVNPRDKWQGMRMLVGQHAATLPDLKKQFKKIVISRLLAENLLVGLLQYIGLMFTTLIAHPAPVWFASGSACAFIFMRGYRILPGIGLGSFLAYYFMPFSMLTALGCAFLQMAQAGLLLWTSHRWISPSLMFYQIRPFVKWIIACGFITAVVSLLLSAWNDQWSWLRWIFSWLANLNGIFIVGSALVSWDMYFPEIQELKKLNPYLTSFLYGGFLLVNGLLLWSASPLEIVTLTGLVFILTLFISWIFDWCGALAALFISALMLSLGAYLETPLFVSVFSIYTSLWIAFTLTMSVMIGLMLTLFIRNDIIE